MTPREIASEKYVSLTTYRRDGSTKSVPVWIADLGDGTIGFTTGLDSYKSRRIQNDKRVELQPCDSRGRLNEDEGVVAGTAQIVVDENAEPVRRAISEKYGWQALGIGLWGKFMALFGKDLPETCGVLIELDS